jgi:hypothetical protein
MKYMLLISTLIIVSFAVFVFAEGSEYIKVTPDPQIPGVIKKEMCAEVVKERFEQKYDICTYNVTEWECSGPTNSSCTEEQVEYTDLCLNGTTVVTSVEEICEETGFMLNDIEIDTRGYICSAFEDGKTYLVCDSKYDGNGDGVCTPGESCVRFGAVGGYITREEKNSEENFASRDDSFVLDKPEVTE